MGGFIIGFGNFEKQQRNRSNKRSGRLQQSRKDERVLQEGKEWRSPGVRVSQKGSAVSPREAVSPTQRIPPR